MKTSATRVRSDDSTSEPRLGDHCGVKVVDTLKQFDPTTTIAVAGSATHCSIAEARHALLLGERLALQRFRLLIGSIRGAARFAALGSRLGGGDVLTVLQKPAKEARRQIGFVCASVFVADESHKHRLLADLASAMLIIGNGDGDSTLKLVNASLSAGTPVIALSGSTGILAQGLPRDVSLVDDLTAMLRLVAPLQREQSAEPSA